MRKSVLERLKIVGISQETYDHDKHWFTQVEACFIELNELYDTQHSFADLSKHQ